MKNIRNFCVIAHIDHGKSTLSDRLLDFTQSVGEREKMDQQLDDMDLERERGITIKSHAIQMNYKHTDGTAYVFNMIDTPGHVDFSYEVSRSIAACEGALLLVDATQGIQAQTISNLFLALEHDLEIIPVLNKVDMETARIEEMADQMIELTGCDREDIIEASGKTGIGVVVERVPAPEGDPAAPLQALIFDSVFNPFRGVIAYVRVMNGSLKKLEDIRFIATGAEYTANEVGAMEITPRPTEEIKCGSVGYIITGVKNSAEIKVGDTITLKDRPGEMLSGFEEVKPMVFAGIFPLDNDDFEPLRDSLEKLQLNDASLIFEPETSAALGYGFRCGFLGMLHLEIVQERLFREFGMDVITTVPNVTYRVTDTKGVVTEIRNPAELPEQNNRQKVEEPIIFAQIITTTDYIGAIMNLCIEKRGTLTKQTYLSPQRVELHFELPLAEIVFDFYDRLKSISRGYASFDYQPKDYQETDLVRMDIKLNGENVDALSALVHRSKAQYVGRGMCKKLRELLPRQQFMIAIQAAIGAKVIARETLSAMRKDVTAKCYGGDITRKREVPQKAFLECLKLD